MLDKKRLIAALFAPLFALALTVPAFAQGATATPTPEVNPNASISWPPPVYVLRGNFEIRGSANLPNMTNYFIDFRPLEDDLSVPEDQAIFFPAVLPRTTAVQDDVLGVWDTTLMPDGLYELRLTVNVRQGRPVQHVVRPLRIENNPPPFEVGEPPIIVTPTLIPSLTPTFTIPPTIDPTPRVTVTASAGNVRQGDGTNYPIIATLSQGQTAEIVGISNRGTGWYQVRLLSGQIGWMAPSIVSVSGDLSRVPRVAPPPSPTPAATPTPISQANLVAGIVALTPSQPVCGQTFVVGFDVANLGTQATFSSGIVSLRDVRTADGLAQQTTIGGFPILAPGQTFRVEMPLTVSTYYNEGHRLILEIDTPNQIPETNEADNARQLDYALAQGACGGGGVTPSNQANLVAGNVGLNPFPPTCNQLFIVGIDVSNQGSVATTSGGAVQAQDIRIADGLVQQTAFANFGVLQPGETVRVDIPMTVTTYYDENHRLVLIVDANTQIAEGSEGDNVRAVEYTLQRGGC